MMAVRSSGAVVTGSVGKTPAMRNPRPASPRPASPTRPGQVFTCDAMATTSDTHAMASVRKPMVMSHPNGPRAYSLIGRHEGSRSDFSRWSTANRAMNSMPLTAARRAAAGRMAAAAGIGMLFFMDTNIRSCE